MDAANLYRLNVDQIQSYLPHRYPFLMLDRILEIQPVAPLDELNLGSMAGAKAVALKNISYNEPQMLGHFPGNAIMPGVLILETMAQASAFTIYPNVKAREKLGKPGQIKCVLIGVDEARFRRPVVPGDTLRIECVLEKGRERMCVFKCKAFVENQLAAEAVIMANISF